MTETPETPEHRPLADLTDVPLRELAEHEGDEALEATLARLKREVDTPREAVSGFSSAI